MISYKYKCNLKERKKKKAKTGKIKKDVRCRGNNWFIPYKTINSKKKKGYHPATYPEKLVEYCIKIYDIDETYIGKNTILIFYLVSLK